MSDVVLVGIVTGCVALAGPVFGKFLDTWQDARRWRREREARRAEAREPAYRALSALSRQMLDGLDMGLDASSAFSRLAEAGELIELVASESVAQAADELLKCAADFARADQSTRTAARPAFVKALQAFRAAVRAEWSQR